MFEPPFSNSSFPTSEVEKDLKRREISRQMPKLLKKSSIGSFLLRRKVLGEIKTNKPNGF